VKPTIQSVTTLTRVWFMDMHPSILLLLARDISVEGGRSCGWRGKNYYSDYVESELRWENKPLKKFLTGVLQKHGIDESCLRLLPVWGFTVKLPEALSETLQTDANQRIEGLPAFGIIEEKMWVGDTLIVRTNAKPTPHFLETLREAIG
jgi:hypothetical protein